MTRAGSIVFRDNLTGAAQAKALAGQLRNGAGPPLVMVDQEGGDIRTVDHVGPPASQPLQGGPANVRRAARSAGRGLRAAGVNVNLAPVADVPGPGSVMASRAFAGDDTVFCHAQRRRGIQHTCKTESKTWMAGSSPAMTTE